MKKDAKMFNIQNFIIAVAIALACGSLGGSYIGYKCTKNHYEAKIAKERDIAQQEVIQAQQKLIAQERSNAQSISKIEQAKINADKAVDELYIRNSVLARKLGGLRIAGSCQTITGASSSSSSKPAGETGYYQLSEEATGMLLAEAKRADSLASYSAECYAYAKEIEVQRNRINHE